MRTLVHWNVRNRFVVAFVLVAVVPLVVFGATRVLAHREGAARGGAGPDHGADDRRPPGAPPARGRTSARYIRDYSVWDEFHTAIHDDRGLWIRNNVTDWVPASGATNLVTVYGTDGTVVARGGDRVSLTPPLGERARAVRAPGDIGADLVALDGRLYVLAAAPIVAQTYPSRPAGRPGLRPGRQRRGPRETSTGSPAARAGSRSTPARTRSATTDPTEGAPRPRSFARRATPLGQAFTEGDYTSQLVALRRQAGRDASRCSRSPCAGLRSRRRSARSTRSPSRPSRPPCSSPCSSA